jgi:hypothetical protein
MEKFTFLEEAKIRKRLSKMFYLYFKFFKIAKINDCRIEDTGKKLITSFKGYRGSSVTLKEKIILCNGVDSKCESFDGSSTVPIAETQNGHDRGCMAINEQGRPTIIAGYRSSSVEILETRF